MGQFHFVELEKQAERRHYLADDLILHRKDVLERPVVLRCPLFGSGARIDQRDSNANLAGLLVNAALQQVLDSKLLPYLLLPYVLTLVAEPRIARDDKDTGKPREAIDQLVADTIAEVLLLRV